MVLGYFMTFLFFYFSNVLFPDKSFFVYLWYFVQKATFLLLPLISALLVLISDAYIGLKSVFVNLIPLSLAKLIYSLPYYYLIFVFDPLYSSDDAIIFSPIQSIFECIFLYVFTLILFFILRFILGAVNKSGESRAALLSKNTKLDFSDPVSLTFAIASLLSFLYYFIVEIVDTVSVISRYTGRLLGKEIVYIVFSYAFDVALLIGFYFILAYLKNYIVKYRVREE